MIEIKGPQPKINYFCFVPTNLICLPFRCLSVNVNSFSLPLLLLKCDFERKSPYLKFCNKQAYLIGYMHIFV